MIAPALRADHLYYAYDGQPALQAVDVRIAPGERLAILGQNGSGKTTLVKHFIGLLKPTRGRVWVGEQETTRARVADLARQVGYVFQNPDHQISQPTVRAEIGFGLRCLGFPPAEITHRVRAMLTLFELERWADQPPAVLGFGLRRKVALAGVLAVQPPILILDEPTSGLDAQAARTALTAAEELNRAGHTLILVTHDLRRAALTAERWLVLSAGRVLADGPAQRVLSQPALMEQAGLVAPPVTQLAQALRPQAAGEWPVSAEAFYHWYQP